MNTVEHSLGSFLVNQFGDRYLYAVNRNAFNRIGSDSLYSSMYSDKLFNEFELNIVIGTDSGILPNYISKCGIPAGSRYIFVELPEIWKILSESQIFDTLPPEISVITIDDFDRQARAYELSSYAFLDAVRVHQSVGSTDANIPEYRDLAWDLNLVIKPLVAGILLSTNHFPFVLRQLENLTENQINFSKTLVNAFAGRTAIILAGGPSLTEVLPWVRDNRDRLVVIAVSRISRTLLEAGIVPHIITSVDPTQLSFEISREMLLYADLPEPPLFIASYHVTPLLLGQWAGQHVYAGPLFPWPTPLNGDPLGYHGPTVSNFSISLCMHMGCTAVVLAGVNNCFSAQGQTHAAGSNESKVGPDLGQMSSRIETYGGWYAETNQSFISSIRSLEIQAKQITEKGLRIYNCSENAAKVPFIDYISTEDIEFPDFEVPIPDVLRLSIPPTTAATRLAHYRKVKKEIERAQGKLHGILKLSREALKCADGLFGRNGMKRDFRHKIRMDKIERKLDQSFGDFSKLVKQYGTRKFLMGLKTTMADEMTDEQIESATRGYYETYVAGTQSLIEAMQEIIRRIEARIEETAQTPDFARLAAQWERDRQFGRVRVWLSRNADKKQLVTDDERDVLERLEQQFSRVMTEERTSHIVHLEKVHNLKHTKSKALLLFKRKEISELEAMLKGLVDHPDQEQAAPYQHFVNGLIDELQDRPAEAIENYQALFTDPPHFLTEDALLQVVHISLTLKDADSALLALECLVAVSPTYLPAYAELLKAVGRFEEAFQTYNRYVGLAPDDLGAMISLAMLCKEAGLADTAQELFQRVLEKDPKNRAALSMLEFSIAAGQG